MSSKLCGLFFILTLLLISCTRLNYAPKAETQTGLASWYGPDFHGKLTSNKEIYDMYDLTAAHKTLAFGTMVMVTNLDNGKTVIVRINDRGPFVGDRIIDLSFAAARVLGMIGPGTIPVRLDILKNVPLAPGGREWSVQVGSFIVKDNASTLAGTLRNRYENVYVSQYKTPAQIYFRVRVKAVDEGEARKTAQRLNEDGFTVIVLEER